VQQFNFDPYVRAEEVDNDTINALDPNLKPFLDRGGKLIQYHGWSDPQISPASSTQYYARVVSAHGGADRVHGSYRLFMAPGMGHCGGGEGPNTFDMVSALEQWVEAGKAPDSIQAARRPVAPSIARARCVRIRRWPHTQVRAAPTMPQTFRAARRRRNRPRRGNARRTVRLTTNGERRVVPECLARLDTTSLTTVSARHPSA
jgi:hypothetical protein